MIRIMMASTALLLATPALAVEVPCGEHDAVVAMLGQRFGEAARGQGEGS